MDEAPQTYTAFEGIHLIVQGDLASVVLAIKRRQGKAEHGAALIFSDETGRAIDFNFQGGEKDVQRRLEVFVAERAPADASSSATAAGPGRPKLGVVSREVSLLPRHWEWLAAQPGGASATLRKLVEEAKRQSGGASAVKRAQERAHRFMSAVAGDLPGYEEALRALYRREEAAFGARLASWPADVRAHVAGLAREAFA